jgi:hypothetical protein
MQLSLGPSSLELVLRGWNYGWVGWGIYKLVVAPGKECLLCRGCSLGLRM